MTPARPSPLYGRWIAGYRLERLLGQGGMGAVHLARTADGTACAIKLLDLGAADAQGAHQAFEREVALSRRLDHPGIVRVLDAGHADAWAFIAMEFVAGVDLGQLRCARHPLPLPQVLRIAARVAHALAHAHGQGVVHRDIKPANILVDPDADAVKLTDFGLARLSDLQRSRTGVLAGTPAYMAPEQLAEAPQDARADLYSLGVVLYELLAGRLPHEGASLGALLREVSRTPPPPLGQFRPDTPAALRELVAQLLEKDRARRPTDADTLARRLDALCDALPSPPPQQRAK